MIICTKSVLRHKYLILNFCHPYTLYLRHQGCEGPWLFFEAKRGAASRKVWGTVAYAMAAQF